MKLENLGNGVLADLDVLTADIMDTLITEVDGEEVPLLLASRLSGTRESTHLGFGVPVHGVLARTVPFRRLLSAVWLADLVFWNNTLVHCNAGT